MVASDLKPGDVLLDDEYRAVDVVLWVENPDYYDDGRVYTLEIAEGQDVRITSGSKHYYNVAFASNRIRVLRRSVLL